ncbi:MAG: hypothetical protein C0456_00720 [Hyphomonas sp.]|uniref:hypothetical protein n=1 Tax=Hyphomonas sp. TaxID=87 RepID=UPI001D92064A|nr:hypothetical protein [Hyphomonas sp.]MBA4225126.1 hypothetical protein [Hyphomonas sp.]
MASATATLNRPPAELYIGGAADEASRLVLGYSQARRRLLEPKGWQVRYFPHYRIPEALDFARAMAGEGRPLGLIGHSWGADGALRVARRLEGEVLLIGADPVAKPALPLALWQGRPEAARILVHVDAVAEAPDRSDRVKTVGYLTGGGVHRAWREADHRIATRLNHWNFAGMMAAKGPDGRSAEDWLASLGTA